MKQKPVIAGSAGYHGYWGLDFTTVDPHLGTEADFAALVDCAHRLGLKVYLDVVVNHTADVILPQGGSSWAGTTPVPRLQRARVRPGPLRRRPHLPVPEPAQLPADAEPLSRRRAAEEAGLAQRRHRLPQPRRHQLHLVLRALLRAGRLLRARRPLHRAAEGGAAGSRSCGPRGSPSTRSTASGSTRRGTSTRRSSASGCRGSWPRRAPPAFRTSSSSARSSSATRSTSSRSSATAGSRTCSTSRCRRRWPASRAATRARAGSRRGSATTTTSASPTAARRCRRRSSATTTWAAPR